VGPNKRKYNPWLNQCLENPNSISIACLQSYANFYLDPWTGVQHDVFDRALDILSPGHQPRHLVVMTHLLPLCPRWWFRILWVPTMRSTWCKDVLNQMDWRRTLMSTPYLLQLMIMSSGRIRRFSMPIFGWSPLPRNKPGGSIRKLAMRSLWLSMIQKPYSCRRRSFSSLIFLKEKINKITFKTKCQNITKSHFRNYR